MLFAICSAIWLLYARSSANAPKGTCREYPSPNAGDRPMAQVVQVEHELGRFQTLKEEVAYGIKKMEPKVDHGHSRRRKAFWRELQAMLRLRSPHTVHVYGAITSRNDCYILVMELLPGGDLRTLLKNSVEPLQEDHARRIIRDICSGMAFLHRKETVHGDLKSPNVLFDGAGRAKVKHDLRSLNVCLGIFSSIKSAHTTECGV